MPWLDELLYPQLRAFPLVRRTEALKAAKHTALDVIELVGIALAVILVTAITRYQLDPERTLDRLGAALLNFLVAIPLLALCAGPFLVRRTRRGLTQQLKARKHEA